MERIYASNSELLIFWGKNDNHVPSNDRMNIHKKLLDTSIKFSWHEFNAQHAFMRDEGDRYDAEVAAICYQLSIGMFNRTLLD